MLQALADGFTQAGFSDVTQSVNSSLFDPVDAGVCPALPSSDRQQDLENQLKDVSKPDNFDSVMAAMQKILGYHTQAGNLSKFGDYFYKGYWEGETCLAASFAEVGIANAIPVLI